MATATVVGTTKNVFKQAKVQQLEADLERAKREAELSELSPEEITRREKAELERLDRQKEITRRAAAKELAEFDGEAIQRAATEARLAAERALFECEYMRLKRAAEQARIKEFEAEQTIYGITHRLKKTCARNLNTELAAAMERYKLACSRAQSQWTEQYSGASTQQQAEKGLAIREKLYAIIAGFGDLTFEQDPLKIIERKTRELSQLGFALGD